MILHYIHNRIKDTDSKLEWVMKCVRCFVACFERLVRFVNRHAYIEVLLRNKTFCGAVAKTVALLTGNFLRLGALMGLVSMVLILGAIFIIFLVTLISFFVIKGIGNL